MVAETRRILAQRETRCNRRRGATAVAPDWKARAQSRPRRALLSNCPITDIPCRELAPIPGKILLACCLDHAAMLEFAP